MGNYTKYSDEFKVPGMVAAGERSVSQRNLW